MNLSMCGLCWRAARVIAACELSAAVTDVQRHTTMLEHIVDLTGGLRDGGEPNEATHGPGKGVVRPFGAH